MGWSNYILLHKQKIKFAISRHIMEDRLEDIEQSVNEIINISNQLICEYEYKDEGLFEKRYMDFNLEDFSNTAKLSKNAFNIGSEDGFKTLMLLSWLKDKKIKYEIKSEHSLTEKEKKYITIG